MAVFQNAQALIDFLQARRSYATEEEIRRELEWSRATFYRALGFARENGECIEGKKGSGFRLQEGSAPASWKGFPPRELEMLAILWKLFSEDEQWSATYQNMYNNLLDRLRSLGISMERWENRIHYFSQHRRKARPAVFQKVSHALLHRRVMRFCYTRSDGSVESREVHPQQLVLYRNGWSLDALDATRIGKEGPDDPGLRQFALDLMSEVRTVQKAWQEVPVRTLREYLSEGYGLFSGRADAEAAIRFTGKAAFYAGRERWHPDQKREVRPDGSVVLRFPFVSKHPEELIGDILRWGEEAEVLAPVFLKKRLKEKIRRMAGIVS